jgi:uncharacterized membrane protein YoaK (UPF0700 family)
MLHAAGTEEEGTMETERDVEQSLPKVGATRLPQGRLSEASGLLAVACLFSAGGYMNAFSYLAHGHVFANSQTGNFVFFAVFASEGQWVQAGRHLPPIAAFALRVAIAKLLDVHSSQHPFRAAQHCQAFELAILGVLVVVGARLPNATVVPIISFVAALQHTSFDRIGSWPFNSAMTTGNLRDAASGLVLWIAGRETAENRRKATSLGLVCCSFLAGAFRGASYTRFHMEQVLAPCVAIVAAGFLLTWRLRRKAKVAMLPTCCECGNP